MTVHDPRIEPDRLAGPRITCDRCHAEHAGHEPPANWAVIRLPILAPRSPHDALHTAIRHLCPRCTIALAGAIERGA